MTRDELLAHPVVDGDTVLADELLALAAELTELTEDDDPLPAMLAALPAMLAALEDGGALWHD